MGYTSPLKEKSADSQIGQSHASNGFVDILSSPSTISPEHFDQLDIIHRDYAECVARHLQIWMGVAPSSLSETVSSRLAGCADEALITLLVHPGTMAAYSNWRRSRNDRQFATQLLKSIQSSLNSSATEPIHVGYDGVPDLDLFPVTINPIRECRPKLVKYDTGGGEAATSRSVVLSGLTRMATLAPGAHAIVQKSTPYISLLRNENDPGRFTSMSQRDRPGQSLLLNAHLLQTNFAKFACAVLHEAVHSLLYRLELSDAYPFGRAEIIGPTLISPWTGGKLTMATAIHAVYVYYALWELLSESAIGTLPSGRFEREFVQAGFNRVVIEDWIDLASLRNKEARNDLRQISDRMRGKR